MASFATLPASCFILQFFDLHAIGFADVLGGSKASALLGLLDFLASLSPTHRQGFRSFVFLELFRRWQLMLVVGQKCLHVFEAFWFPAGFLVVIVMVIIIEIAIEIIVIVMVMVMGIVIVILIVIRLVIVVEIVILRVEKHGNVNIVKCSCNRNHSSSSNGSGGSSSSSSSSSSGVSSSINLHRD